MRAETGPIQFEDDWTGIFIRGDDAFRFLKLCESLDAGNPVSADMLEELKDLLASCNGNENACLKVKRINECMRGMNEEE